MTQFKIIKPITVDDTNFVSSTLTEADYAEWNSGTTYSIGNRVILTTGFHKIYESLTNSNLNNNPATSTTNWIEVSPTNRWAVFDESASTVSSGTAPIEWVVNTGRIDSVAVLGLENATSVQIIGDSTADGEVYNQTITIEDGAAIGDWFAYFFSDIILKTEVIVNDIPLYQDLSVTIIINGASTVGAGLVLFGKTTEIGATQYNASSGIIDYSRKETDTFGKTILVRRKFSKRMNVNLLVENGIIDAVQATLAELRATPALWVGAQGQFELLTVYGFYRDFNIDIAYTNNSLCSLEIEGLT